MEKIKDITPSVIVLIVSADGDEEMAARVVKSSARDCLKKPGRKNSLLGSETQGEPTILPSSVTHGRYHKIQQAVRFINDNYRTNIRRDAVAGEAGMSPSHFSRMFRKVMGVSYQEYLNSRRITEAKNLLRTSAQSVTEIAISLSFADSTGFGRIFKKLTGHTPSAYRSLPQK
jgi:AraC-like DNA-binding protein